MTAPHLELSIALSDNERTRPLLEGRVAPQGIKLVPTMVHPSEMFWRQLRFAEFDISEMSWSSLLMAIAGGDKRWVALPVFTARGFPHTGILVHHGPRGLHVEVEDGDAADLGVVADRADDVEQSVGAQAEVAAGVLPDDRLGLGRTEVRPGDEDHR